MNHYPIQWVNTMVVTLGFALFERFCPYTTWNLLYRVHTQLLLDKSAHALRRTLLIIDIAHAEFLSSLPSVLTVDTSDLVHHDIFYQSQLHQVSCHHLHQVGFHSRTTLSIILLTNIISHQTLCIIFPTDKCRKNVQNQHPIVFRSDVFYFYFPSTVKELGI